MGDQSRELSVFILWLYSGCVHILAYVYISHGYVGLSVKSLAVLLGWGEEAKKQGEGIWKGPEK